jgi:hypothetical protein
VVRRDPWKATDRDNILHNALRRALKMKVRYLLLAVATAFLAVALPLSCAQNDASAGGGVAAPLMTDSQVTGIHVSGEGKVSAVPDLVVISLGVEVTGEKLEDVHAEVSAKMDAVMKAVRDAGIEEEDIQTLRYYVSPETRPRPLVRDEEIETEVFFREVNIISIKVRDIDKVGSVLDGAIAAGANSVGSISFTIEDPKSLQKQARDEAMADAKAKAEQLAQQDGVSLRKPSSIAESIRSSPMPRAIGFGGGFALDEAAPGVSINAGELDIRVNVSVIYTIE